MVILLAMVLIAGCQDNWRAEPPDDGRPPPGSKLAEVLAYNRDQPERVNPGEQPWPIAIGESGEIGCAGLPYSSAVIVEMRPQNCWYLALDYYTDGLFVAGYLPGDHSQGAMLVLIPGGGVTPFSEIVPLPDGALEPVIHAVTSEAVCFTTADDRERAFHLDRRRLVPITEAPTCPPPPSYTRGDVEKVDCREVPEGRYQLESLEAHDCHRFAVDARHRGYTYAAVNTLGQGAMVVWWPTVGERIGHLDELVLNGADVRVTRVDLARVCFTTDKGEGAFELGPRQLVDGPVKGCPGPDRS